MSDKERSVSKSRFKPRALEYFRRVQESGEPIVVTERGRPVLKIIPYVEPEPSARLQALRGTVLHYEDPLEPVGEADWEALR